jgi:hypothetical protein
MVRADDGRGNHHPARSSGLQSLSSLDLGLTDVDGRISRQAVGRTASAQAALCSLTFEPARRSFQLRQRP